MRSFYMMKRIEVSDGLNNGQPVNKKRMCLA